LPILFAIKCYHLLSNVIICYFLLSNVSIAIFLRFFEFPGII
jgi:hypothetical protein